MYCDTCCSFPNGYITIAPCLLSIVAYILTSISTFSCHYAETQINEYSGVGVGLTSIEMTERVWYQTSSMMSSGSGSCTPYAYSDTLLDTKFKTAQGCGITAWVVGFFMAVFVWSIAPCVASHRTGWRIIGGMFFLIGCLQAFTLLILSSNVCSRGCSLSGGGATAIFAFLLWWVTAAICCMVPNAREPNSDRFVMRQVALEAAPVSHHAPPGEGVLLASETTTQRVEPDGSTVIEKISTNPDGSTTVTTSVIPPATFATAIPDANFKR